MSRARKSSLSLILSAIIILTAAGVLVYLSAISQPMVEPGHENLAFHGHVRLTIHDLRTRTNLTIPGNIGLPGGLWFNHTLDVYGGVFAPLHTHGENGIIHIEPTTHPGFLFTLGDFFNIWGVPLDARCVWNYCASAEPGPGHGPPIMATKANEWLEGFVDPSYKLRDGDEILILIGTG